METSHNEISSTQWKQATMKLAATQWKQATIKLAKHNGNKLQHNEISTTQ